MATKHLSALKRDRQSKKNRERNKGYRTKLKNQRKRVEGAIEKKDAGAAQTQYKAYSSAVDKAMRVGIVHWKTAARSKSRMQKRVRVIVGGGSSGLAQKSKTGAVGDKG